MVLGYTTGMAKAWFLIVALQTTLQVVYGSTVEYDLLSRLLTNYSYNVRPVANPAETLNITLDLSLNQIVDLNERYQYITLLLWIRLKWVDASLQWNPETYGGIYNVRVLMKEIWKPDITLYNSLVNFLDLEDELNRMKVYYNGTVQWNFPKVIKMSCSLDVEYYPWDIQVCGLKFGSWTYPMAQINIWNAMPFGNLANFEKSGEWELLEMPCRRNETSYITGAIFPDVTCFVVLQRKPLYYIFNLILPCVFIKTTALLAFCLPPESGEKVSLNVTVLLALTVFLLMVADTMPPQSLNIPLMGQYFAAVIVLLSASTMCTVLVINIHHRGVFHGRLPPHLERLVFQGMATLLCMRRTVNNIREEIHQDRTKILNEKYKKRELMLNGLQEEVTCIHFSNLSIQENGVATRRLSTVEDNNADTTSAPSSPSRVQPQVTSTEKCLEQILATLQQFRQEVRFKDAVTKHKSEWMLLAFVLDRFFLVLFILLAAFMSVFILCQYLYNPKPIAKLEELNITL